MAIDRHENIPLMEPLLVGQGSKHYGELADLAIELASKSSALRSSLPPGIRSSIASLVRSMNCYYSNLIEGHNTHPVDIERALKNDYSADPIKRNLQLEAKAHIAVQQWIDEGGLFGKACTAEGIRELHRRFGELLPGELLRVADLDGSESVQVIPGELRSQDVKVGQHIAISPGALPRFLNRFEEAYSHLGKTDAILSAATAHHRLLWIHPFLDGNGRVARLMSHAILLENLNTGGLWSVARGLARNHTAYKAHLADCDAPRRGDLDGRGNLSEIALAKFAYFFLRICIDQVDFLEQLLQPDRLKDRIMVWSEEEIRGGRLPQQALILLEAVLYRGALPRGDIPNLIQVTDRHARRITGSLIDRGILISDTSKSPLKLAFPAQLAHRWMPGSFPEY